MFQAICHDPQSQHLGVSQRSFPRLAVSHATWQLDHVGNPATISLALDFDFQIHALKLSQKITPVQREDILIFVVRIHFFKHSQIGNPAISGKLTA
jgi:hypothetical protein